MIRMVLQGGYANAIAETRALFLAIHCRTVSQNLVVV
jgi:hypothetical protein